MADEWLVVLQVLFYIFFQNVGFFNARCSGELMERERVREAERVSE
jgi:hypothetical protein